MTAVAERPVTKILAAVAGFFVGTRRGVGCVGMALSGFLSEERAGGDGRRGSFSISRRPHPHHRRRDHRYDDRRHDLRPHHGHHHHLHDQVEGEPAAVMGE